MCRGFWGYCIKYHPTLTLDVIDLETYSDPDILVRFLAYIRERGVQTPQILKHISVSRKVLDFLVSGSPPECPSRVFIVKMDCWLNVLSRQLTASAPSTPLPSLPPQTNVTAWAMNKVSQAMQCIDYDIRDMGTLTRRTAEKVMTS